MPEQEQDGEGRALLFSQEGDAEPRHRGPAPSVYPGAQREQAEERGQERAAGEDVDDGFGLDGVDGEEYGADEGGAGRHPSAQDL